MEIWILSAAGCVVTLILGAILVQLSRLKAEYVETFTFTLRSLVKEWNALAQTVNALTMTLPEAGKGDTGHLTASEGDLPADMGGMSPGKRDLYIARRKAGSK